MPDEQTNPPFIDDAPIVPPFGLDRADGVTPIPQGSAGTTIIFGTPDATGAKIISGTMVLTLPDDPTVKYFLEELPDSPRIERADQGTATHRFKTTLEAATIIIDNIGRGYQFADSAGNVWQVLSNSMEPQKGGYAVITLTSLNVGSDMPPPEFSIDPVEFNPTLIKHPRYACLDLKTRWAIYQRASSLDPQNAIQWTNVFPAAGLTELQQQAATELVTKMRKGIDSFYLSGVKLTLTTYAANLRPHNPGGYVTDPLVDLQTEYDPIYDGDETGYNRFLSTMFGIPTNLLPEARFYNSPISSNSWLVNPMLYGKPPEEGEAPQRGMTCLRLADRQVWQRNRFATTRSWICAPGGGKVTLGGGEGNPPAADFDWKGQWDANVYEPEYTGYNTNPNQ